MSSDSRVFRLANAFVLATVIEFLRTKKLDGDWLVVVKKDKGSRSLKQNRLSWMWYTEVANHLLESGIQDIIVLDNGRNISRPISSQEVHDFFSELFLGKVVVSFTNPITNKPTILQKQKGTSDLTVKEFCEYLQKIESYCTMDLELELTRPADLYMQALMKDKRASGGIAR